MKRRIARLTVVLVLVAIAATAARQTINGSTAIGLSADRLAAIAAAAGQADLALARIEAHQRSYVAPGQGLDFWAGEVDRDFAAARAAIGSLRSMAADPATAAQTDSATSRLDDLAAMDRRARDYVRNERLSMASDLIFADGYEIVAAARKDLTAAVALERAAVAVPLARERRLYFASVGTLAGCALLASLLLLRSPKAAPPAVAANAAGVEAATSAPHGVAVADDPIGAALDASLGDLDAAPVQARATPAQVDLTSAADVCVDLGRLLDARDLQTLLGRIADVLHADGLVVWLADEAGQSLLPALTHGYAPAVVARIGTLSVEEDN